MDYAFAREICQTRMSTPWRHTVDLTTMEVLNNASISAQNEARVTPERVPQFVFALLRHPLLWQSAYGCKQKKTGNKHIRAWKNRSIFTNCVGPSSSGNQRFDAWLPICWLVNTHPAERDPTDWKYKILRLVGRDPQEAV